MSTHLFPDVSPATRKVMRANKAKDTKPEMAVRRLVHGMGYRYRLHRKDLPGRPDLVFGPRKKVILVHGCFWHRHLDPACKVASIPKSRLDFWLPKFEANRARDEASEAALKRAGWDVLTIWECHLRDVDHVRETLEGFLGGSGDHGTDTEVRTRRHEPQRGA